MSIFYCNTCHTKFETEGVKIDWVDRTYGPCSRWTASCPDCHEECQLAKTVRAHSDQNSSSEEGSSGGGSCSCGGSGCSSCGGC